MENLISNRQLRALLVLADEQHFGRAADRLGMAAPQLSDLIRRLEETSGLTLFTRRPSVRPTPAGEILIETGRRIARDYDEGLRRARAMAEGKTGRIRVGMTPALQGSALPSSLRAFQSANPGCLLSLSEGATARLIRSVDDGSIDLAITRRGDWPSTVEAIELLPDSIVVGIPSDHPAAQSEAVRLADLNGEPFIFFGRESAPQYHDAIVVACDQAGLKLNVVQEVESWGAAKMLAQAGFGLILSTEVASHNLPPGLVSRPILDPMPSAAFWMSYRPERADAATLRLARFLAEAFTER